MLKKIILFSLLVSSSSYAEEFSPKDMRLGKPLASTSGDTALIEFKSYEKRSDGITPIKPSQLKECLVSYLYIHLGAARLDQYSKELAVEEEVVKKDGEYLKEFDMKLEKDAEIAETEQQIADYNENVAIYNEVSEIHQSHIEEFNKKVDLGNKFSDNIKRKTLYFFNQCRNRPYYQTDYEEIIETVEEESTEMMRKDLQLTIGN